MRIWIIIALLLCLMPVAKAAWNGCEGWCNAGGMAAPPPPTCTPGTNGQMDFSICSNLAITAAVMP